MHVGDSLTIQTESETLQYRLVNSWNALKGDVPGIESLSDNVPGRLVIFTCFSEGERDAAGVTAYNSIIVLQLVVPEPEDPSWE